MYLLCLEQAAAHIEKSESEYALPGRRWARAVDAPQQSTMQGKQLNLKVV
jgi:hypothetical protein